jgi:hypothetical protein
LTNPFAVAQNIKRGYKQLEKLDYEKAKELFEKITEESPDDVGAHFGLAMVYADNNSGYFDIVEAWYHIHAMKENISRLTQEEIEVIGEYFINTEVRRTSRPVKKKIDIAIEAVEAKLIKYVREENNLDIAYRVLEKFPDFRHYDNIIHIRNQLEFRKYEKQNTLAGYVEFITNFPQAAQIDKAKKHIYKLAFQAAKSKNTVAAYNQYLNEYPESEYYQTAIKHRNAAAFAKVKQVNTIQAYEDFIAKYPNALEISEARVIQQNLLYQQAKRLHW